MAAATDSYLPTSAEHAAWITKTPEKFLHASFKSEDVDEGHRCITAELREEPGQREVMAHFFDQTKFTAQEAQVWCSEQQLMVADFIPSKETNYPQVTAHGPREVTIYGDRARVIRASGNLPRISIDPLYSGGELNLDGFLVPLVVELAGMQIEDTTSILYAHDDAEPVGQGRAAIAAGKLTIDGEITGTGDRAKQVVADAANGYQWRASMGVELIGNSQIIEPGKTLVANGQSFNGPLIYWPKSRLKEASVLGNGADHTSKVSIAAHAKRATAATTPRSPKKMEPEFVQWVQETYELDAAALAGAPLRRMQAAWQAHKASQAKGTDLNAAIDRALAEVGPKAAQAAAQAYGCVQKAHDACSRVCNSWKLDIEEHKTIRAKAAEMRDKAIAEVWPGDKIELEMYRLGMPTNTVTSGGAASASVSNALLEASFARATGAMKDFDKQYSPQVLEALDKDPDLRRGITLKGLLVRTATAHGFKGRYIENGPGANVAIDECIRRSFEGAPRYAEAADSTISLPGIMSNLDNKFLYQGFWGVDPSWRQCSFVRSVTDFKPTPAFRIFGATTFEKLGPHGEIKHGVLGETAYANRAELYAKMLTTTFEDIRNDDLGALSFVPQALGRGAALGLLDVFFAMVLSGKDFFGNAMYYTAKGKDGKGQAINVNKFTGVGSSIDGSVSGANPTAALSQARKAFRNQVGPDGKLMGYAPKLMLVPSALESAAEEVYKAPELRAIATGVASSAAAQFFYTKNIFQGLWEVACSAYLGTDNNPQGTTGSDTGWYLLGDQGQVPVWELLFLDGNQAPVIESSQMEFSHLGIVHRGYHAFGAGAVEPRGVVYNAGV